MDEPKIVTLDGEGELRVFSDALGLFISVLLPARRIHLPLDQMNAIVLRDALNLAIEKTIDHKCDALTVGLREG